MHVKRFWGCVLTGTLFAVLAHDAGAVSGWSYPSPDQWCPQTVTFTQTGGTPNYEFWVNTLENNTASAVMVASGPSIQATWVTSDAQWIGGNAYVAAGTVDTTVWAWIKDNSGTFSDVLAFRVDGQIPQREAKIPAAITFPYYPSVHPFTRKFTVPWEDYDTGAGVVYAYDGLTTTAGQEGNDPGALVSGISGFWYQWGTSSALTNPVFVDASNLPTQLQFSAANKGVPYWLWIESVDAAITPGNRTGSVRTGPYVWDDGVDPSVDSFAVYDTTPTLVAEAASTGNAIDRIEISFSENVENVDVSDLALTLDGSPVANFSTTATVAAQAGGGATSDQVWIVSDLSTLTSASGDYVFTVKDKTDPPSPVGDIQDGKGNDLSADATATWTKAGGPEIASTTPVDNATDASQTTSLVIVFDRSVTLTSGNETIRVYKTTGDVLTATILAKNQTLSPDTTLTTSNLSLDNGTDYYVQIDAGIVSASGVNFAGIADEDTWNFSTPNAAPVITSNSGGDTAAIDVAENETAVTTVTATDADVPADTLTFSKSGGVDATMFTLAFV